jgi:hypothetical protein
VPPYRLAFEHQTVAVVQEAIEDGIGDSAVFRDRRATDRWVADW